MMSALCFFLFHLVMLLRFHSGLQTTPTPTCTLSAMSEEPTTVFVHRGNQVTMNCHHYFPEDQDILQANMKRKETLCFYQYNRKKWLSQNCKDNITMNWNNITGEISLLLLKVQIHDSGLYTCELNKIAPPPEITLSQRRIHLHVTAPPTVSVSVSEESSGLPIMLCSSQGFYPEAIEQVWFREGQPLNTTLSDRHTEVKPDGSFTFHSFLPLSSGPHQTGLYSCWVNHSALSHPITVNHTASRNGFSLNAVLTAIGVAVLFIVMVLILMITMCLHFKIVLRLSPLGSSNEPGVAPSSETVPQVYSTLGDHHPVCLYTAIPGQPRELPSSSLDH